MLGSGGGSGTHSGTPRGRAVRLTALVAVLAAALLAQPVVANADHTPTPSVVALVGSLQSELGCPGDWQPECPQTRLSPVAGSPDLWQATFDVPAGAYAYKVALNNGWDENYGAGGAPGGADIPMTAPGGSVTFTYDHSTHVISDDTPRAVGARSGAHWLAKGVIAWDLGDQPQDLTYRLFSAPNGGITLDDGQIVGRDRVAVDLRPGRASGGAAQAVPTPGDL